MEKRETLFERIARIDLKAPALRFGRVRVTYARLIKNIRKMASFLRAKGVKKGDVVTTALPNTPETIYAFYALDYLGAIQNIVHPLLPLGKIFETMDETSSHLAIVSETLYQANIDRFEVTKKDFIFLNPLASFPIKKYAFYLKYRKAPRGKRAPHLDQLARYRSFPELFQVETASQDEKEHVLGSAKLYLHSGGTTGVPKIIMLSDEALNNLASKVPAIVGQDNLLHDGMLSVLPLFHGFGLGMGVHAPLAMGACCYLQMKFNPREALRWVNKGYITMMIGVPALYQKLMKEEAFTRTDMSRLKFLFIGGDKVPPSLITRYDEFLASHSSLGRMLEGYGLTETVTVCAVNTREAHKAHSVGRGLEGIEIEVRDEAGAVLPAGEIGEVYVHGNTTMEGYYEDPLASKETLVRNARGLCVKTGDLGYLDSEGYLFLKGRKKRVFIIAGFNVYPTEVEKVATDRDEVADAALEYFEHPTPHMTLFVIRKKSAKTDDTLAKEIMADLEKNVLKYSLPRSIRFVESFPATPIGKTDHQAFKE